MKTLSLASTMSTIQQNIVMRMDLPTLFKEPILKIILKKNLKMVNKKNTMKNAKAKMKLKKNSMLVIRELFNNSKMTLRLNIKIKVNRLSSIYSDLRDLSGSQTIQMLSLSGVKLPFNYFSRELFLGKELYLTKK
jgi:hypothetical protein